MYESYINLNFKIINLVDCITNLLKKNENLKIFEMYENMDQDDIAEISNKKEKVKTVQLEIFKEQIETLQKRYNISEISHWKIIRNYSFFLSFY